MGKQLTAARRLHQEALAAVALAAERRKGRDQLIRMARADDPVYWTHERLGKAVGLSPEMIAVILRSQ